MTQQQYTPVSWQDETTSQQGTLINAERLNQMQTAHHYADGLEEVDTVPTADPGVAYHKIVYCTADNTLYRWDGTQWTADIDDPTRELLEEHEADHDNPHQVTKSQVGLGNCDNTSDADKPISTATQTALDGKLDKLTFPIGTIERAYVVSNGNTQSYRDIWVGAIESSILKRTPDGRARASFAVNANTDSTDLVNYGWISGQLADKADKATTYTKGETDTLLGGKADKATTLAGYGITDAYTKTEADTLLGAKVDKLTTSGESAYTHNGSTQSERAISYDVVAGSIPRRDSSGYLQGATNTTGTKSNILATGTRVQNDLDNYAPMVRTTGNQTIAGVKTFTSTPVIEYAGSGGTYALEIKNTALVKGTAPTSATYPFYITIKDKNGARLNDPIGVSIPKNATEGQIEFKAPKIDGTMAVDLAVHAGYITASTRAYDPTHTTDVATIGTLDAYTPMVRTTGNQDISGIKSIKGTLGTPMLNDWFSISFGSGNYVKICGLPNNTNFNFEIELMGYSGLLHLHAYKDGSEIAGFSSWTVTDGGTPPTAFIILNSTTNELELWAYRTLGRFYFYPKRLLFWNTAQGITAISQYATSTNTDPYGTSDYQSGGVNNPKINIPVRILDGTIINT